MAIISDPGYWSQDWSGTSEDDLLIYNQGREVIDGGAGYDVLKMPFPKSHYVYIYQGGALAIDESELGNPWSIDLVTGVNIEQVQFFDQTVTLVPRPVAPPSAGAGSSPTPGRTHLIQWGSGGRWMKYSRTRENDTWWLKSGKGKRARYLVDNDVDRVSGVDAGRDALALGQGSWADVYYKSGWGGTILFSGANVLAFLEDFNASGMNELTLQ